MKAYTIPPIFVVFSLLATALSGCAVLTIDVDVYKGPLANQEKIQVQQISSMAMAAKPLLIQLRNNLEYTSRWDKERFQTARQEGWYRDGFVPPDQKGYSRFTKPQAIRVNAILKLYEDLSLEDLESLVRQVRNAIFQYQTNRAA